MIITIEEGSSGLWYAVSPDLKGMLIAEKTLDEVLDKIAPTIKSMCEASKKTTLELLGQ